MADLLSDPELPCPWADPRCPKAATKRVHDEADKVASSWACDDHLELARQWVRDMAGQEPVESDPPVRDHLGKVKW